MGAILAKFRKEKTTYQILENLETKIKDIEQYSLNTQARQKRFVGYFLAISIALYVLSFIIFYFAFFPPTWTERITYSVPLLIFPMIIFFLKRLVAWYFQRKLNKNSSQLSNLRAEKKKIIEKVMDKETYKVALEILNRFADKTNSFKSTTPAATPRSASSTALTPISPSHNHKAGPIFRQSPLPAFPSTIQTIGGPRSLGPSLTGSPLSSRITDLPLTPSHGAMNPRFSGKLQEYRKRTPYPIINQQDKGVLEKMVDYLIGDGPHHRFAMICKECYAHNGMALQEEYEYAAFRCAFCNTMNPSRKSRPVAPKLLIRSPLHSTGTDSDTKRRRSSTTSSSERDSGAEEEDRSNLSEERPIQSQPLEQENDQQPEQVTEENTSAESDIKLEEKPDTEKKND